MFTNGRNNQENLKELFEKFVDSKQAQQAADDIRKGEQMLGEHAAPEPDKELIADIKAQLAASLLHSRTTVFRQTVYRTAVAAAAVIVLVVAGVKLFEKSRGGPESAIAASIVPEAIWESNDVAIDDADLATLIAEIEQMEGRLLALQLGEDGGNGSNPAEELEMELVEINSDFWKG